MKIHVLSIMVGTIAASLLVGLGYNTRYQAQKYHQELSSRCVVAVFLEPSAAISPGIISETMVNIPGVARADYVSADMALNEHIVNTPLAKEILVAGQNPFTPYFLVTMNRINTELFRSVSEEVQHINGVTDVRYDMAAVEITESLDMVVRFYRRLLSIMVATVLIVLLIKFVVIGYYGMFVFQRYAVLSLTGIICGYAGAALYYFMASKILPSVVVQLPASAAIYCAAAGWATILLFERPHELPHTV